MNKAVLGVIFLSVILIFGSILAQDAPPEKKEGKAPAAGPMERYLPKETMLYIKVRDASSLSSYFEKSPLYAIWEEKDIKEGMKEQIEEIKKTFEEGLEEFERETKLKIDDILSTIKGEVTFALVDFDVESFKGRGGPKVELTISIEAGDKKEELQKIVDALQKTIMDDTGENGPKPSLEIYKDQKIFCFGDAEVMLSAAWLGDKWVFSFNKSTLHGIIDKYLSKGIATNSLEHDNDFKTLYKKCGGGKESYFAYIATKSMFDRMKEELPEEIGKVYADMGLFEEMKYGFAGLINTDGAAREISCTLLPEKHKILNLLDGTEIDAKLYIPPENIILWASGGLNVTAQYNYIMNILATSLRQEGEDLLEELEKVEEEYLGFELEEELIKAVGKSAVNFYLMLPEGGGAFPELALTMGVVDKELMKNVIEKYADKMGENIKTTDYQGKRIYYFSIDSFTGEETDVPYWPSFALAGNKFLAASSPQVIKRIIGNLEKPIEPSGDIKKALAGIPKGSYQFAYADTKKGFSYLYNTLIPYLYKNHNDDMPEFLDPAKLPPVEVFTKHLSYIYTYGTKEQNTIYGEAVSPAGPVTLPFAALLLGASIAFDLNNGMKGFAGNRTIAEETAAISTLRTLSSAQELFNVRFGNYAGGLRALAEKDMIAKDLATGVKYNYMFEMKAEGPDKWRCIARPLTPGKRYFFIDESGVIRHSQTPDIGPESTSLGG